MNLKLYALLLLTVFLTSSCTLWYDINTKKAPSNLSQLEASLSIKKNTSTLEIEERAQFIRDSLVTDFALSLWKVANDLSGTKKLIEQDDLISAFNKETQTKIIEENGQIRLERENKIVTFSAQDKLEMAQNKYSTQILFNLFRQNSAALTKKKEFSSEALSSLQNYLDLYAALITRKALEYSLNEGRKKVYARHVRLASEDFFDIPHITKRQSLAFYSANAFEQSLHYLNLRLSESKALNIIDLAIDEDLYHRAIEFVTNQAQALWLEATKRSGDDRALLSGVDVFDAINNRFPFENSALKTIRLFPYSSDVLDLNYDLFEKLESSHLSWQILVQLHHKYAPKNSDAEANLKPLDVFASEQLSESLLHIFVAYVQQRSLGKSTQEAESYLEKHTKNYPETNTNPEALKTIDPPTPWKNIAFIAPKNWKISPFKSPFTIAHDQMTHHYDSFRGIAASDINNDGYTDLFIAHEGSDSRLYLNSQGEGFQDVTQVYGLSKFKGVTTAHFADFNNDGCRDLLLIRPFEGPALLQNTCKGQFIDVTAKTKIQTNQQASEALWVDVNNDGWLDLILTTSSQSSEGRSPNLVFIQNKNNTFDEMSKKLNLDQPMNSIAALALDMNQDGLIDLFFVNDLEDNAAFLQSRDGKFTNSSTLLKLPSSQRSRGAAIGDVDGDQRLDLYITNLKEFSVEEMKEKKKVSKTTTSNQLLISKESGFENQHSKWFPKSLNSHWVWNHFFFDAGNRGQLDLLILNGHRPDSIAGHDEENHIAFHNNLSQTFDLLSPNKSGLSAKNNSRSAVAVDLDQNGSLDIVINGLHQPIVYKNTLDSNKENWIKLELIGSRSNRDALGARVKVYTSKSVQTKLYGSVSGAYLGHSLAPLHFGLDGIAAIDRIEIFWPSGHKQTLINVEANQSLQLTEPL